MKYRKKPVVIEALQFTGRNSDDILMWSDAPTIETDLLGNYIVIKTLEGDMRADQGDWIIKGVKGEFYPVKPDIFAATYDEVEPEVTFMDRLNIEHTQLFGKIHALDSFIDTKAFEGIAPIQQGLLKIQLHAMKAYCATLVQRINLLKVED